MARTVALWLLLHVASRLPERVLDAGASLAATVAWHASQRLRDITRDHMRHALGPGASAERVEHHARRCVDTAAAYYADLARTARMPPATVFDRFDAMEGMEHLFPAYDEGRGVILVSAHLGNPEVMARAATPLGLNLATLMEPLRPPRLHRLLHRVRANVGGCFLPATPAGMRSAIRHLRRGGTVALALDRHVTGHGVPFPLFGERAPMPPGGADLARLTGAPVLAVTILRSAPGRYRLALDRVTLPPATGDRAADRESAMRALVAALERSIAHDPGQWFVLTPIWRGIPNTGAAAPRRRVSQQDEDVQSKQ